MQQMLSDVNKFSKQPKKQHHQSYSKYKTQSQIPIHTHTPIIYIKQYKAMVRKETWTKNESS